MRRSADRLPRLLALLLASTWAAGCGGGAPPAGPTAEQTRRDAAVATAELRDPLLFEHNARFFGGRAFRWIPPVPIFVVTSEPAVNAVMQEQLDAWETTLAGIGGSPLFAPQAVNPSQVPSRGIFFTFSDLDGRAVGVGDPFIEIDRSRRGPTPLARQLRQLAGPAVPGRSGAPEILASGEIQRCRITLDPVVTAESDFVARAVVRHELGHCLGFIGHVSRGLMRAACCSLDMTRDVVRVMRRLYGQPPGSVISR